MELLRRKTVMVFVEMLLATLAVTTTNNEEAAAQPRTPLTHGPRSTASDIEALKSASIGADERRILR